MSSMIFYKIPYEGEIKSILKLIKDRDWGDITVKFPEKGILLMKVPKDIEDEVTFNEDIVFDDTTNTKFCSFTPITETEFEQAQNIENLENKEEKKENKIKRNQTNEQKLYYEESKRLTESIVSEETEKPNENKKQTTSNSFVNYISKISSSIPDINLQEFTKDIGKEYKEPYDYLFTQRYLVYYFIVAVIFLIVFGY